MRRSKDYKKQTIFKKFGRRGSKEKKTKKIRKQKMTSANWRSSLARRHLRGVFTEPMSGQWSIDHRAHRILSTILLSQCLRDRLSTSTEEKIDEKDSPSPLMDRIKSACQGPSMFPVYAKKRYAVNLLPRTQPHRQHALNQVCPNT